MDELLAALLAGNYTRAVKLLRGLEADDTVMALRTGPDSEDPTRAVHAAAVAELFFYMGRNAEARALLSHYADQWEKSETLIRNVPCRTRLQVAEYFYSKGEYDKARRAALRILDGARSENDDLGGGEAAYFLMRTFRRLHKYEDVFSFAATAVDAFSRVADRGGLQGRLGRVQYVLGFTHWRSGDLDRAQLALQTASGLLMDGADFMVAANVRHTLGSILRSRGQHTAAGDELMLTRRLYAEAGHQLNLVRVGIDLARLSLDTRDWKGAADLLDEAAVSADRLKALREQAEIALWRSWLYQLEGSFYYNPSNAFEQATFAVRDALKVNSLSLQVEGIIAWGYALLKLGEAEAAKERFGVALSRCGDGNGLAKHRANALLSLADLYSSHSPIRLEQAARCYDDAMLILTPGAGHFLRAKADVVKRQIAEIRRDRVFVRTTEDLEAEGLAVAEGAFTQWAIDRALSEAKGNLTRAAKFLKMNPDALRKRQKKGPRARPPKSS
jgi:tetratricopeptide (TPR) repeat protein